MSLKTTSLGHYSSNEIKHLCQLPRVYPRFTSLGTCLTRENRVRSFDHLQSLCVQSLVVLNLDLVTLQPKWRATYITDTTTPSLSRMLRLALACMGDQVASSVVEHRNAGW